MDMLTSLSRLQTFAEGRQPTYVSSLLQLLFACPALRSKFVEFRSLEALALTVHVQPAGKGVGVAISNLAGATVLESDFEAGAKVSDLESFFQEQKLCPERVSFISPDGQVLSADDCLQDVASPLAVRQTNDTVMSALSRIFADAVGGVHGTKPTASPILKEIGWEGAHDPGEFFRVILQYLPQDIQSSFTGIMDNYFSCPACGKTKLQPESFTDSCLHTRPFKTLYDSLDHFLEAETIPEYRCDFCGNEVDVAKGVRLTHLPSLLLVTLTRFHFDMTLFTMTKIEDHRIECPQTLVLKAESEEQYYTMVGAVLHEGPLDDGLCSALVFDLNITWYLCSGNDVAVVSDERAMELLYTQAVIILYQPIRSSESGQAA
eukprot:TRINITY_DN18629_c0_g1_i1.p1 TRINITY_DN18629_c0_g1~~TRINITY_DN18629_c0_g1_i1.p1  ORF type:complete len:376 (-),score=57.77 TRINITY_DN18629_c0_g1_i1:47-1174(-)